MIKGRRYLWPFCVVFSREPTACTSLRQALSPQFKFRKRQVTYFDLGVYLQLPTDTWKDPICHESTVRHALFGTTICPPVTTNTVEYSLRLRNLN